MSSRIRTEESQENTGSPFPLKAEHGARPPGGHRNTRGAQLVAACDGGGLLRSKLRMIPRLGPVLSLFLGPMGSRQISFLLHGLWSPGTPPPLANARKGGV